MLTDILLSIFGGGATGLFGTFFSRFISMWETKQERKFTLEKYTLDAELRARETEHELQVISAKAAQQALSDSYKHDSHIVNVSPWVQNIRALVRPTLTTLLWVLVGGVWFTLPKDALYKDEIIQSILYAATLATVWWFGARGAVKK